MDKRLTYKEPTVRAIDRWDGKYCNLCLDGLATCALEYGASNYNHVVTMCPDCKAKLFLALRQYSE